MKKIVIVSFISILFLCGLMIWLVSKLWLEIEILSWWDFNSQYKTTRFSYAENHNDTRLFIANADNSIQWKDLLNISSTNFIWQFWLLSWEIFYDIIKLENCKYSLLWIWFICNMTEIDIEPETCILWTEDRQNNNVINYAEKCIQVEKEGRRNAIYEEKIY